jgi:hypothetical protein
VGIAVDHEHVLGPRRLEDVVQGLLGERDVLAVVVALAVVHPRHRNAVLIGRLGRDSHSVVREREQLA